MSATYVLIDYENVHLADLSSDLKTAFKVLLFIGKNQAKIPLSLATAMQNLGTTAEHIKVTKVGNNALDFHIAFYLGKLISQAPKAKFYIISKDKGYEPLIAHVRGLGFKVQRRDNLQAQNQSAAAKNNNKNAKLSEQIVAF